MRSWNNALQSKSDQLADVTKSYDELNSSVEQAINDLQQQHLSKISEIEKSHQLAINELRDALASVKGSSAESQDSHLTEIETLKEKIKCLEKELNDIKTVWGQKDSQIEEAARKSERLSQQLVELNQIMNGERATMKTENSELLKQIQDLEAAKEVLKTQYSELSQKLKQVSEEGQHKEAKISQNIESQAQKEREMGMKIKALLNEIEEYKRERDRIDQNVFNLKREQDADVQNLRKAHADELSERARGIQEKEQIISELQNQIKALDLKLMTIGKESNSSEKEVQLKDAEILNLKKEVNSLTERVRIVLKEVDQKQTEIDGINKQIEINSSEHKKRCQEYIDEIQSLTTELSEQQKKANDLLKGGDAIKRLEYEITILKKVQAEEINKLKSTIEKEVRSKITLEKKYKDQSESLETQISILNKDIKGKLDKISALSAELLSLKEKSKQHEEEHSLSQTKIESLTNELQELALKHTIAERQLAELNEKFGKIPNVDIEAVKMKEKIAMMKEAKIHTLLSKIDHVMGSMESNMSWYLCMEVFSSPITINPCGHNFCSGWFKDHKPEKWPKCDVKITATLPDAVLDDVVSKYLFERDILAAFKNEDIWKNVALG